MLASFASPPPKPVAELWRPELVSLPKLTLARRLFRSFLRKLARLVVWICLRTSAHGLENLPRHGPALVVTNHLGDADVPLLLAAIPGAPEALGKIELHDEPRVGWILDLYGMIWVHRGRPDRRALRAALDALGEGRVVCLAPEGRQSTAGGLEQGLGGAAFLALKAQVPIVPVALTGTQNELVYGALRRWQRARVTVRAGDAFLLAGSPDRHTALLDGTHRIMDSIAALLPMEYRGAYRAQTGADQP